MVILYLDEPEVNEQMKQQSKEGRLDEFLIGGVSEKHPANTALPLNTNNLR